MEACIAIDVAFPNTVTVLSMELSMADIELRKNYCWIDCMQGSG